ncbi:DNA repair protein rhp57 [Exophiala xenobiotica]|nr:DNA repair protein rhp57 [Exophiala xenobiotica]KAK5430894.1 DNA repair protein rhp57 [Exophiala xenobiotica]KAK5540283.1 DNA repair protein rhp57 [Chaetothyriales sp. CCFEE 6169]
MSDLLEVLPDFDLKAYIHLLHSLEKNDITVADLISLDPIEIARRCPLPAADVQRLVLDVVAALQEDVQTRADKRWPFNSRWPHQATISIDEVTHTACPDDEARVSTLVPDIDHALGGGLVPGHIIEVVGESAVGKTQFVLGMLLSAQLPPPRGLGKGSIYVSTEAPLNTARLKQMLISHPEYERLDPADRPSLDYVHAIGTNDLEAQEHILRYQLPVAIQRLNIGLIVLDSVAANFRAEHESRTAAGLAERATALGKLGLTLRRVAIENNAVVVVTNQVSDRFDEVRSILRSSSPANSSPSMSTANPTSTVAELRRETQSLDHQQRFFTGWGDDRDEQRNQLKNPALGLAWANQISARIVLKMESERQEYLGGNIWKDKKKARTLRVVFAPWVRTTRSPIRYEIGLQGIVSVVEDELHGEAQGPPDGKHTELLDEEFWPTDEDEEFP